MTPNGKGTSGPQHSPAQLLPCQRAVVLGLLLHLLMQPRLLLLRLLQLLLHLLDPLPGRFVLLLVLGLQPPQILTLDLLVCALQLLRDARNLGLALLLLPLEPVPRQLELSRELPLVRLHLLELLLELASLSSGHKA